MPNPVTVYVVMCNDYPEGVALSLAGAKVIMREKVKALGFGYSSTGRETEQILTCQRDGIDVIFMRAVPFELRA
jgi:hypothetical protein